MPPTSKPPGKNLIEQTKDIAIEEGLANPWEQVAETIRFIGRRVRNSDTIFCVPVLLQLLLQYDATEGHPMSDIARADDDRWFSTWVIDVFLELRVPCESILATLETLWYERAGVFRDRNRRYITKWIVYTIEKWWEESQSLSPIPFGSEENAVGVENLLRTLLEDWNLDAGGQWEERTRVLRDRVAAALR